MPKLIEAAHLETLDNFLTRCAEEAKSIDWNFVATFNGFSIMVEPGDTEFVIGNRYWAARLHDSKEKKENLHTIIDKRYTRGFGLTRSVCRLTLSNGKFITAVGQYADVLDGLDLGAKLEISGWSRGN